MYLIGLVVFLVILMGISSFSGAPMAFVDFPSIIVILGISLPILLASGLTKDLLRGFKVMHQRENQFTAIELRRTLSALKMTRHTLILAGGLGTLIGTVGMLSQLSNPSQIGPNMAVALLTVVYAIILTGAIVPIQYRIEAILSTFSDQGH